MRLRSLRLPLLFALVACLPSATAAAPVTESGRLHVRAGRFYDQAGKRVAFYGVNLFQTHLLWSRRQNPADYEPELAAIAKLGFNAVRMPLNMAWFEPAPGVFPDSPEYASIMQDHELPSGAVAFYDGLIRRAGELGLYVIPEFHELPADPYRWFVGGEEKDRGTDKPGRAIAWMALPDEGKKGRFHPDPALEAREVPRALGWLAAHWRGVPNIAGIEVPWNEPRGPLTEGAAFFDLCRDCAQAIKQADPGRLVFMDCVDWGAMVNRIDDESVWKIPDQIDALFPHFYPGMHSGNSGADGTWSTTMANWASWLLGSGRPVMVGEYGVVEMKRAGYWKNGVTDAQRATTYAACASQWYAMGLQGIFCWAWGGGIGWDATQDVLTQGAEALPKWAAPFEQTNLSADDAKIAVICDPKHRASYGSRQDLWRITDALLDAHLTPFATVFSAQVAAQPEALQRFRCLLVLDADLPGSVLATVRKSGKQSFILKPDLTGLADAVAQLRTELAPAAVALPANVIVGYADRQVTVFERKGQAGTIHLHLEIPNATGSGRLIDASGKVWFTGTASALAQQGVSLDLSAWQCTVLRWDAG